MNYNALKKESKERLNKILKEVPKLKEYKFKTFFEWFELQTKDINFPISRIKIIENLYDVNDIDDYEFINTFISESDGFTSFLVVYGRPLLENLVFSTIDFLYWDGDVSYVVQTGDVDDYLVFNLISTFLDFYKKEEENIKDIFKSRKKISNIDEINEFVELYFE